jgi:hypothetical protein
MCFATLGVIGAGISAAGTVFGGIAQGESASYQAQVAANNAQIARQNATYAEQVGNTKQQQAGLKAAEEGGAVKTALAANNVDVNTGSAVDVEAGTRQKGVMNQYLIQSDAELQAYGYRTQATGFDAQAALDKSTATSDEIGGALGAAGGLLSSASSIGPKWGTGSSDTGAPMQLQGAGG